ncbi:MAG: hypothetical protein O7G83_02310, partial [Proteobacteria bacterium]|nr:hypothetical protein [Pseudomonadota bacterium]
MYERNDGPRRKGIFGVWAKELDLPIDFSTATATIEIIQEVDSIKITAADPDPKTPLEPSSMQGFQAIVEYILITQDDGEVVLNLFNADGDQLASGEPVPVERGTGEDKLTIESIELPAEGPIFLSAELRDETGVELVQSADVVFQVGSLDFSIP